MKVVFLALNSSYIHTLLAPRYLVANCSYPVEIIETNVNIPIEEIVEMLLARQPDVLAISCYIFNIKVINKLLPIIKDKLPDIKIILGGYEVSYTPEDYLDLADYILQGEGDLTFGELILDIYNEKTQVPIKGTQAELVDSLKSPYTEDCSQSDIKKSYQDRIIKGAPIEFLDSLKSPYTEEYCSQGDTKIIYYESSRGCPFKCSYCMSSDSRVRAFSLQRVYSDLDTIMSYNPKLLKFVDRTFNYNLSRAKNIIQYIIQNYSEKSTTFHFEVAPELFDDELLALFSGVRENFIQLEIGIQSFNQETLRAVNRKANPSIIEKNVSFLAKTNVHIHTDLIAGLPYEGYLSFVNGFNKLYLLSPDSLQLGFLKVLKGAPIENDIDNYRVSKIAPYEIISTPWLNENEIKKLKIAEDMLNLYHNSGRFKNTLSYIVNLIYPTSPFSFFYELGKYYISKGMTRKGSSAPMQSQAVYDFIRDSYLKKDVQTLSLTDVLNELTDHLNTDFENSGNIRKWKRKTK